MLDKRIGLANSHMFKKYLQLSLRTSERHFSKLIVLYERVVSSTCSISEILKQKVAVTAAQHKNKLCHIVNYYSAFLISEHNI